MNASGASDRMESTRSRIDGRTIATRGGLATVVSLVGNWLFLAIVLGADLVEPFDPVSVGPVTLLTVLGAVGATVVYWLLDRRSDDPDRLFIIVAAVVLILSFVPDLALLELDPEATISGVIALMIMHVIVAVGCVGLLTDRYSPIDR